MTSPTPLVFADGIPGFPGLTRFALVDVEPGVEESVFQLLQSLEDESIALVVTQPWKFFPDYAPELPDDDQAALGLERAEDAIVFCSVTFGDDPDDVSVNLLGPFVVNLTTRQGRQVVLTTGDHPVRAPIAVDYV